MGDSRRHFMLVAGARPNFMKIAPILKLLDASADVKTHLVHTGQHYDKSLSDVFFDELNIRKPDSYLNVGSGTHAKQTAEVMMALEVNLSQRQGDDRIDRVVVVGDVNSTMAATLAASKLSIPVAHVEAGLRSRDRTMPEEINRIVTDALSDLLLCSEPEGVENLLREGHSPSAVHLVGNVMIDTLKGEVDRARSRSILSELGVQAGNYGLVTLHRPSNVDSPKVLGGLLGILAEVSTRIPLIFPVHPRTRARLAEFGLEKVVQASPSVRLLEPLGYLDFLCLSSQAKVVVTDSGGLQEETTALGVPCLTMRANTERPITCSEGTGMLIGDSPELLRAGLEQVIEGKYKVGRCPSLWDGRAAERIVNVLLNA